MKRLSLIYLIAFLSFSINASAQFGKKLVGNNKYVTITKPIPDFTHLIIWPKVNVYYATNPDSVGFARIHGEENVVHLLDFSDKKGKLDIAFINNMSVDYGFITITLYSSSLAEANVEGAGVLEMKGKIQSPELKLSIGGNGQIITSDLQVQNLKANVLGSGGDILLKGKSNNATFLVTGTGDIRARNLIVDDLSTRTTGTGNIFCHVEKTLKSRILGTGSVFYYGKPEVKKTVIGSGVVAPIPDGE
ncbi:MAG: GIN domain-containing protein [Bacteroidales bacterium]